MGPLSSETLLLGPTVAAQIVEVAQATSLDDLRERAEVALRMLLPPQGAQLLLAGDEAPAESGFTYLSLRAAGQLLGWIAFPENSASPEQEQGLQLLAAVLAPAMLALARPTTDWRREALLAAIGRLRRVSTPSALLQGLSEALKAHVSFQNVFWMLRYDEGEWAGIAHTSLENDAQVNSLFWKANLGLSGAVLIDGQPIYADDYGEECRRRGIVPIFDERMGRPLAWYGVPLRDQDSAFGALVLFSTASEQALSAEDRTLIAWFADEVAPTVLGAQRYARAAEEASRRTALNLIARQINRSLDPERVPALIVERAPGLLNAEEASLLLLDAATGELEFRYAAGPAGNSLIGRRVPPGEGVAGFVAASGEPSIVNDTSADGRFYRALDGDSGFQTRSIVAVPLRGLDGVKGVLEVLNRRDNAPFTERDRELLEALADQAMIALENARQFASKELALARRAQELDRSNDRLVKILRASNALRAELPIPEILTTLASVVVESSGFRSAIIALVQRERTREPYLYPVAAAGGAVANPIAARMPLARLQTLLRPELRLGSLSYLIERHADDVTRLWGLTCTPSDAGGTWRAGDALFCLLRDSRGEISGLIGVDQPEDGNRPSAGQLQILEILANQAAAALENARLYASQQHSLGRMMALNGLGRALSTTLRSPQQIYELTASGMLEMSDARWAAVFLDQDSLPYEPSFRTGLPADDPATVARLAQAAVLSRRPLSRTEEHEREALLCIPLLGSSRCLGAICVGYDEGLPDAGDIETLILFASQAASAVESLMLLGEVHLGRDQLASIMASTREGMLLVGDNGRVEVANSAFFHLAEVAAWPERPAVPTDLADMTLRALLHHWQSTANFPAPELEQLYIGLAAVADGLDNFMTGQLNGMSPGARSLEWSVLRATREGSAARVLVPADEPRRLPILLTVRDITAAKEAERLRSDLTNMMVHDLRSPLASVISSFDLIFRGVIGAVTPQQRDVLMIAHASTEKLLNMINLLLDISRLEGGRMPIEPAALTVDELATTALTSQHVLATTRGVTLEPQVVADAQIYADRELVLRVLQNLLDNALKFSLTGGSVRLAAWPDPENPGMVRFSVSDSGIGIQSGDLEKIFTKFGQSGNRRNSGSGLGLTFCKLVVENHGGKIWVESSLGRGSSFFFTLPATPPTGA